ncbi:Ribosomal protein L7/L12 C-terminal domain-containing protein [Streptomyces sp. 2323.1]|nr:Ribosomal protein L7/L12 C-terminal domain-containing protein [Streptomyces sp. 2323.1]
MSRTSSTRDVFDSLGIRARHAVSACRVHGTRRRLVKFSVMDSLLPGIALLVLAIAMVASGTDRRSKTLERRLQRLEKKVDLLLAHAGVAEPEDPRMAEIDELLTQGKKIQAIKVHRELTGSGLVEAKEAVERRMR